MLVLRFDDFFFPQIKYEYVTQFVAVETFFAVFFFFRTALTINLPARIILPFSETKRITDISSSSLYLFTSR